MGEDTTTTTETRTQTMYDLTVATVHTFAVGDGDWVVHNKNCFDNFSEYNEANRSRYLKASDSNEAYNGDISEADLDLLVLSNYAHDLIEETDSFVAKVNATIAVARSEGQIYLYVNQAGSQFSNTKATALEGIVGDRVTHSTDIGDISVVIPQAARKDFLHAEEVALGDLLNKIDLLAVSRIPCGPNQHNCMNQTSSIPPIWTDRKQR